MIYQYIRELEQFIESREEIIDKEIDGLEALKRILKEYSGN